jgi:outer membrane protein assembly factor BamB
LAALDLNIGKELWVTSISTGKTVGIDIQPTVYNDKVYVSTVPGSNITNFYTGGVGVIYALDQRTGKVEWNFSTVDSADIWGNKEIDSGGGCWVYAIHRPQDECYFLGCGQSCSLARNT